MISKRFGGFLGLVMILFVVSCGGSGGLGSSVNPIADTTSEGSSFANLTLADIQELDFSTGSASLNFNENTNDNYLLIVNAATEVSGTYSVQLTSISDTTALTADSASRTAAPSHENNSDEEPTETFHEYLREMENVLQESGNLPETPASEIAALALVTEVGSTNNFRVLSTINSITAYQEVSAMLRFRSDDLLIYVDQNNGDQIDDAHIEELAHNFEDIALPKERALFGRESDINADGHITILMSCVVNRMVSSGGLVTGFFFPGDMYQRGDYNPASNTMEMFHVMMPDSEGRCGTPVSVDFAVNNILPGVLAHEYQHLTSFSQHVFRNGGSTEESWLNECLSHFTEDITGFGNENPSRVKLFLAQPATTPLIPPTSPTLSERGGCYLFLRYLYEQSEDGDAFISRLYQSRLTGVANLEMAFAGTDPAFDEFSEFASRWSLALALSETGVTDDPKYNYQARVTSSDTGNFTGVCIRCDTQDGRGTVLGGPVMTAVNSYPASTTLSGTATQFYELANPSGAIRLSGNGSSSFTGSLVRLTEAN